MSEINKYLEGQYEGNIVNKYKQMKDDEQKAIEIAEKVKTTQDDAMREETQRILGKEEVNDKDIEKVLEDYAADDEDLEYLVNGAILKCDQATLEDFSLPDGTQITLEKTSSEEDEKRKETVLSVLENPIHDNGKIYATVSDYILNKNIIPFNCNCLRQADRSSEISKIKNDPECNKHGVCRHLIQLNNEWENYSLVDRYLSLSDDASSVRKSGITMTSILFCSHGGIISPVKSGQIEMTRELAFSILDSYLGTGEYVKYTVECSLKYLAALSTYELDQYESVLRNDYNKYDDYILGWTEYYNEFSEIKIDPNYIKSQCYQETRFGYKNKNMKDIPAANAERDIMQALDVRNGNIYEYIGISPSNFYILTSEHKYITGSEIWALNHKKSGDPEPIAGDYKQEKKERCGGIIETLFNTQIDGTGDWYLEGSNEKYYYQLEKVTPILSIGMGMDRMRILMDKHAGDYKEALKEYNLGADKENYAKEIIDRVDEQAKEESPKLE